jgi:alpha-tubulin suppressor-like RCC1 family protein
MSDNEDWSSDEDTFGSPLKAKGELKKSYNFFHDTGKPTLEWALDLGMSELKEELAARDITNMKGSKEDLMQRLELYVLPRHSGADVLRRFYMAWVIRFMRICHELQVKNDAATMMQVLFRANALRTKDESAVYTWGYGRNGQLGHASQRDELQPRRLMPFHKEVVQIMVAGASHTLALTEKGLYHWGASLTVVTPRDKCEVEKNWRPTLVPLTNIPLPPPTLGKPPAPRVKALCVGESHCCLISEAGALYTWGEV